MRNAIVQAVSAKYGNDEFKVIYIPDSVYDPRIGMTIDSQAISRMVSNTWTITILPVEEAE